jgi:hypothetical protein
MLRPALDKPVSQPGCPLMWAHYPTTIVASASKGRWAAVARDLGGYEPTLLIAVGLASSRTS